MLRHRKSDPKDLIGLALRAKHQHPRSRCFDSITFQGAGSWFVAAQAVAKGSFALSLPERTLVVDSAIRLAESPVPGLCLTTIFR